MNIQAKLYQELKDKNAVNIVKVNKNTFAFVIAQFDAFSGEQKDDAIEQVSIDAVTAERDATQEKLDGLNAMLADIQALK